MAKKVIAVLATLDTKGDEAAFLREQLNKLGSDAWIVDLGVLGEPAIKADVSRQQVAQAGGKELAELRRAPKRENAAPVMVAGATKLLREAVTKDRIHGVIGLGPSDLCHPLRLTGEFGFTHRDVSGGWFATPGRARDSLAYPTEPARQSCRDLRRAHQLPDGRRTTSLREPTGRCASRHATPSGPTIAPWLVPAGRSSRSPVASWMLPI